MDHKGSANDGVGAPEVDINIRLLDAGSAVVVSLSGNEVSDRGVGGTSRVPVTAERSASTSHVTKGVNMESVLAGFEALDSSPDGSLTVRLLLELDGTLEV